MYMYTYMASLTNKSLSLMDSARAAICTWCSVRVEAVMALGSSAHFLEGRPAMDKLIKFYTDRCFEKDTHRPKPHRFESMAEQVVNQVTNL